MASRPGVYRTRGPWLQWNTLRFISMPCPKWGVRPTSNHFTQATELLKYIRSRPVSFKLCLAWFNGRSPFASLSLPFVKDRRFLTCWTNPYNLVSLRRSTCYTESCISVNPCCLALRYIRSSRCRFNPYSMLTCTMTETALSCLCHHFGSCNAM